MNNHLQKTIIDFRSDYLTRAYFKLKTPFKQDDILLIQKPLILRLFLMPDKIPFNSNRSMLKIKVQFKTHIFLDSKRGLLWQVKM